MLAGIRVVRGPDWIWQNQDGGEGHVGTVCEIGRSGSAHSPEKTVVVNWDSGHRTNYRVGYQGQYDLIIVDNAQIGVKHPNIICDGCSKVGIAGIRFRCAQCSNFDLCSACYGSDIHDLDHTFIRYQTSNSVGVRLPPRENAVKIELKGIFVGAKVVRGADWEWGMQDGGEGKTGRVMEIRGWDNESCRSVANVSWISGSINVYRLGHQGNVDLKYVQPASGGWYYRDHMPVLGQMDEQQPTPVPATTTGFSVGDRVKIYRELDVLKKLQKGHGGWNPRMAHFISKIGIVHRVTDKGDIRVQYDGCTNRWTINPAALVKVYVYNVGDLVTIINNMAKVKQLQKGHGEWIDTMKHALGKTGKVIKVYDDGDLRIQELDNGLTWTLHPACVHLERSSGGNVAERSNSMMDLSHQRIDHVMLPLSGLSGSSAADKLVRDAAQGKLESVQFYLNNHPEQVDVMSGGKTCLQVAAHQGHINLVRYLLSVGANVNMVDKEGDSTLHYAAFGNQPEVMRVLLEHGADINILNVTHCSALHISAHKKPPHCVKVLLEFGADVNIQDSYGDTALHDAIGKENSEVVDLLCNAQNLNLNIRNKRGFNALHHAALKGNSHGILRILQLVRQTNIQSMVDLVNLKKEDGFAPLHLAALNGHAKVVEVLVKDGQAHIDIRNNRRQTPFLLAVSQGHAAAIETLIDLGCDILAKDEDGDNAMHLCIIKKSNLIQEVPQLEAPKMWEIYQDLSHIAENRLMYTILCFLAKMGCRSEPNYKGTHFLDWITDKNMRDLIVGYEVQRRPLPVPAERNLAGSSDANPDQVYSNVSQTLSTSGGATDNSCSNDQVVSESSSQSTAAEADNTAVIPPPSTPARRHRAGNRDTSTPSPQLPAQTETEEPPAGHGVPKRNNTDARSTPPLPPPNRFRAVSPPAGHDLPGASNNLSAAGGAEPSAGAVFHSNLNVGDAGRGSAPSPSRQPNASGSSTSGRHVSRKQLNNAAPALNVAPAPHTAQPQECIVCNEVTPLIIFDPCSHQISCEDCGLRMKKCLSCGMLIERRLTFGGKIVSGKDAIRQPSADRLRYLESKILEIEETHCCSICMERRRNVAFLCGHGACSKCADTLKTCHMCRKTILKKINLY
ncbi:E3 ubiquitin-protein ligase MIB2 isoform X2 [Phlebotomus papatasi]|uniref:E3 ubiquitin-protein ligase MIB2 isoform X2 n=1 Tax=Phlebotomus papatasi TaxID=29031 RepID=UPI00248439A1|nr:E3 ubiquitin-protein ligase MIB2 isoform X2 [Phlebotomus papatasi]